MKKNTKDSKNRQGKKGPSNTKASKNAKDTKSSKSNPDTPTPNLPIPLQNTLLSLFHSTFSSTLSSPDFTSTLQEVKGALFDRDFERAFGKEEYLEAYAARWSPSRALGYADLLIDLSDYFAESELPLFTEQEEREGEREGRTLSVTCLGGGAAEVVALGGMSRWLLQERGLFEQHGSPSPQVETEEAGTSEIDHSPPSLTPLTIDDDDNSKASITHAQVEPPQSNPIPKLHITLLDTAPWSPITDRLTTALTVPPPLSKYASLSQRASNTALLPPDTSTITSTFHQVDLLSLTTPETLTPLLLSEPKNGIGNGKPRPGLITLLFTLNELYNTSIAKTTAFLLNLTACVPPGTVLLVVDSPGSYSVATLGGRPSTSTIGTASEDAGTGTDPERDSETKSKAERKYPMQWLLEHTLLEEDKDEGSAWERLKSEDSRWFRIPEGVGGKNRYPIALENMRFQWHLYRRV